MRIFTDLIFDGIIQGGTAASYTYTDPQFDAMLGAAEALTLMAVCDQVLGTSPTLSVDVFSSCDRRTWPYQVLSAGNQGPIYKTVLTSGATNSQIVISDPTITIWPSLAFCRCRIFVTAGSSTASLRLRLYATGHAENLYVPREQNFMIAEPLLA